MKTHEIALSSTTTITTTITDRTVNEAQEQEHMVDIGGGLSLSVATIRTLARRGWYYTEVPVVGHLHDANDDGEQHPVTSLSLHYIEPWPDPALDADEDVLDEVSKARERERVGAHAGYVMIRVVGVGLLIHAWNSPGYAPEHTLCWFPSRDHHTQRSLEMRATSSAA